MTVHVMVGVSGSGKSTLTEALVIAALGRAESWCVFSADAEMVDGEGVYRFDIAKLAPAHQKCLLAFDTCIVRVTLETHLFVDNTNSTVLEAAPYIALAMAHGHNVVIHILRADPGLAYHRNKHNVPAHKVARMAETISREWPSALPWHWQPANEPRVKIIEERA